MKLVPVRVTLTFVPSGPLEGLMVPSVGGGGFTMKVTLPDVPPLVVTETYCVPVAALAATAKVAVMVVLFTSAVLLMVTPAPLKLIEAPLTKLVPVSVTVTLTPCRLLEGEMEVSVGAGASTVKVTEPEVPPDVVTDTF